MAAAVLFWFVSCFVCLVLVLLVLILLLFLLLLSRAILIVSF